MTPDMTNLNGINLVISTIWREEDYLHSTLGSLLPEYPYADDAPVSLVVGSPVTTHLRCYHSHPKINIIDMGPNTWSWIKNKIPMLRGTWNYYRCLTYPPAGARGTLILEDDLRFTRGWRARLESTLSVLEKQNGSDFLLSLYMASDITPVVFQPSQLYVGYPSAEFFGTQAIYYPAKIRTDFARYLKAHGVVANESFYDILLRGYLLQSGTPLFSTNPCLVQHTGKKSVSQTGWHISSSFVEDVTPLENTTTVSAPRGRHEHTPI